MQKGLRGRKFKKNTAAPIITFILISALIITMFYTSLTLVEKKIMPAALKIADIQTRNLVNRAIDDAVNTTVIARELTSNDFFSEYLDDSGRVNQLSANTVLINEICSRLAVEISDQLFLLEDEKIALPMGLMTGIRSLANTGPKISVSIKPKGSAIVDYKTNFESVGINQMNFKVWLDVSTNLTIVSPLLDKDLQIERKIVLVDTVISGSVPNSIFNSYPFNSNSLDNSNGLSN